ncbi:MAG: ornithine--oxo-acid transaminase [Gammaproteobacteria bacterium]|nr:ornithine--oxo-acid transaminase [Gammaproteobacteria bacterium]
MSEQGERATFLEEEFGAHNYKPLPVVLTRGEGCWVWDVEGKSYLDMMGAYSAVSHGHAHPRIVARLTQQANRLSVVSRAYHTDQLGPFLQKACQLTGMERALPMNTGAEAVETALKAARKWAYKVKGVPEDKAEIIVCRGNFHGRTLTVISMSSEPQYRDGFGPFTPGFKLIPYGDSAALEKAITPNTAAFLVEPIQGEAGIVLPPEGYLKACETLCRRHNVLLICDEIQTGLGRTGKLLASMHESVKPDAITLGKALGGGILPVSLFMAKKEVMDVFKPGDHGSTFGGNPLACAVGLEALSVLIEEKLIENSAVLGAYFLEELKKIACPAVKSIRGKGLFIGVEFDLTMITAREVCLRLMKEGVLSKETHETVVRFAPALIITRELIDLAVIKIKKVFEEIAHEKRK